MVPAPAAEPINPATTIHHALIARLNIDGPPRLRTLRRRYHLPCKITITCRTDEGHLKMEGRSVSGAVVVPFSGCVRIACDVGLGRIAQVCRCKLSGRAATFSAGATGVTSLFAPSRRLAASLLTVAWVDAVGETKKRRPVALRSREAVLAINCGSHFRRLDGRLI